MLPMLEMLNKTSQWLAGVVASFGGFGQAVNLLRPVLFGLALVTIPITVKSLWSLWRGIFNLATMANLASANINALASRFGLVTAVGSSASGAAGLFGIVGRGLLKFIPIVGAVTTVLWGIYEIAKWWRGRSLSPTPLSQSIRMSSRELFMTRFLSDVMSSVSQRDTARLTRLENELFHGERVYGGKRFELSAEDMANLYGQTIKGYQIVAGSRQAGMQLGLEPVTTSAVLQIRQSLREIDDKMDQLNGLKDFATAAKEFMRENSQQNEKKNTLDKLMQTLQVPFRVDHFPEAWTMP